MAKETRTIEVEIPRDGASAPELSPAERAEQYARETRNMSDDDAEDFFAGIDELRATQGVSFQVNRTEPLERAGFCFEYPGGVFTLQRLTKDYGPGTYRIRVKGPGGRYIPGGSTVKIAQGMTIEGPTRESESSTVQDMIALMRADREKQAGNLKEWAAILAPLLAPVIANMFTQKRETVTDMVNALGALKQLEPPAVKAPDALAEIEKVGALLERAKAIVGEGGGSSTGATWVDVIRDGLAGVKDLIASGAGAQIIGRLSARPPMIPQPVLIPAPSSASSPGASPANVSPASTEGGTTSGASTEPVQGGDMGLMTFLPWLRATLDTLVFQAARNKDPNLYAEVTLDNLPDGLDVREMLKLIEAEDWWKTLQQIAPTVIPYAGWFKEFRDAMIKEIKKLIEGAPETE